MAKDGKHLRNCYLTILRIIIVYLSHLVVVSGLDYAETYWQSPVPVYEYDAYRSVRMLQFTVPSLTEEVSFVFEQEKSNSKCEDRIIQIRLQHGGYPVIAPLNESFPEHFNLHRTAPHSIHTVPGNHTSLKINHPLPGLWYAVAFLDGVADDRIKQKGFGIECNYFLACTQALFRHGDIQELGVGHDITVTITPQDELNFRFHTLPETWQYTIDVSGCSYDAVNSTSSDDVCPLLIAARAVGLPRMDKHALEQDCSQHTSCHMVVSQPMTDAWHHLLLAVNGTGNLTLTLTVHTQECMGYFEARISPGNVTTPASSSDSVQANKTNSSNSTASLVEIELETGSETQVSYVTAPSPTTAPLVVGEQTSNASNATCLQVPNLGRFTQNANFKVQYQLRIGTLPFPNKIQIAASPTVLSFTVMPSLDIGGTLRFAAMLAYEEDHEQHVTATVCITKDSIPIDSSGVTCSQSNRLQITFNDTADSLIYFPYPEAGKWFVAMEAHCYPNASSTQEQECWEMVVLKFEAAVYPCVDGQCGDYGDCREYFSGVFHFTSCACIASWRGYACSDDTYAESYTLQLVEALLLTLSNLAFLSPIGFALHRRFYSEALVYTFTMFFSTFYHACDGNRKTLYCMMPYEVMAHCDFYGSIMSFWVTLIAMARLADPLRAFLYMLGALGLAVGVEWDRHSLWTFLVPAGMAFIIMVIAWLQECRQRRECYPSKKRWLTALLPGLLVAGAGLIIFAFFETDSNYKYTHSAWHVCMALAVMFILPPKKNAKEPSPSPSFTYDTFEGTSIVYRSNNAAGSTNLG